MTPRGYIYFYLILRPFLFIVLDIGATLKKGSSFTDALEESKEFDEYMIQMVVVGQSIGNLDVVFKELSTYYARQKELNYQIQDAITYPFVLILMMFVIVATLIFKVFPIFENILSQMSM